MRQTLPACTNVTNVISYTVNVTSRRYENVMSISLIIARVEDDISELSCEEGRIPLLVRPLTVVTHSKPKCWQEPRLQCSSYYSKTLAWDPVHPQKCVFFIRRASDILVSQHYILAHHRHFDLPQRCWRISDVPQIFWSLNTTFWHITDILTCHRDVGASQSQADIWCTTQMFWPPSDIQTLPKHFGPPQIFWLRVLFSSCE